MSRETNPDRDDLSVRCPRGRALIRLDDGGDDEEWCNVLCKYERWRGRSEKIVRLRALRSYNLISNLCDANKSQARQTCIPLPPDYVNISVHFPDRRQVTLLPFSYIHKGLLHFLWTPILLSLHSPTGPSQQKSVKNEIRSRKLYSTKMRAGTHSKDIRMQDFTHGPR